MVSEAKHAYGYLPFVIAPNDDSEFARSVKEQIERVQKLLSEINERLPTVQNWTCHNYFDICYKGKYVCTVSSDKAFIIPFEERKRNTNP
jgi:hypothetical protein